MLIQNFGCYIASYRMVTENLRISASKDLKMTRCHARLFCHAIQLCHLSSKWKWRLSAHDEISTRQMLCISRQQLNSVLMADGSVKMWRRVWSRPARDMKRVLTAAWTLSRARRADGYLPLGLQSLPDKLMSLSLVTCLLPWRCQ